VDLLVYKSAMNNTLTIAKQIVLLGFFALMATNLPASGQSRYKTLVDVDKVRIEPLAQTVPVIGALVAKRSGNVAVEIGGTVRQLLVETGDRVKKGQTIAILESDIRKARRDVLAADVSEAKALLQVAEADLAFAVLNRNRQARLKKSGAFNRALYETTLQQHAKALAQIARAEAAIASKRATIAVLELEISKAKIISPYAGVVVERKTEIGSYVRSGDAVVKLIADTQLEIEANVPAMRLGGLHVGGKVRARLEDGTSFIAVVRASLPIENPRTRTRPVRFTPIWPKGIIRLASAQSVTLLLPVGASRQVMTVHKDAIVNKRGRNVVFIIEDGKAVSRTVKLGVATGGRIEVVAGLKVGDITVVRGNERLRPGSAVKVSKGT
jgi:RND family efflux transporter MFP subunit